MKYVYQVTSEYPITAFTGIGNSPTIQVCYPGYSDWGQAITKRDQPKTVTSHLVPADSFTIELMERIEN